MKSVIVILLGCYSPDYDSTGPNISTKAMCEALSDEYEFKIIASSRLPSGNFVAEPIQTWIDLGYAKLMYLPVSWLGAKNLVSVLQLEKSSVLVLNGFFDREFTIPALIAYRLRLIPRSTIVLTPRGELTKGALSLKPIRKNLFRAFARLMNLHRDIVLHATSTHESLDCQRTLPKNVIRLVPNCRNLPPLPEYQERSLGEPIRLAYLGRISPVKRLDFVLQVLSKTKVPVVLNIFGPIGDVEYKQRCDRLITLLPTNITVSWRGEIRNSEVSAVLACHEALFLPSLSENFGHAIFESLSSGTPVIIGNRPPWNELETFRAGFDLPNERSDPFVAAIERLALMNVDEYRSWRCGARARAEEFVVNSEASRKMSEFLSEMIRKDTHQFDKDCHNHTNKLTERNG